MALMGTEFQLGWCRRIATNSRPVCSAQSKDTQSYKGDLVSTSKKIDFMPQNLGLKIIVMVNGMLYTFYCNTKKMINRARGAAQLGKCFSFDHEDLNLAH